MAKCGVGQATSSSFTVYANGFTGDLSRTLTISAHSWNESEFIIYDGSISDWNAYPYYGEKTVYNRQSGTQYVVTFKVNGVEIWDKLYITTLEDTPPPPVENVSYGISAITETSFRINVHGFTGDLSRILRIYVNGHGTVFNDSISNWNDYERGYIDVSGLIPNTTYTVDFYIDGGYETSRSATTLAEKEIQAVYPTLNSISKKSFSEGWFDFTVSLRLNNPNNHDVFGRIFGDVTIGNELVKYQSENIWISANSFYDYNKDFHWYVGDVYETTVYVASTGSCYKDKGSTSGAMISSDMKNFSQYFDLSSPRPGKFYWINSKKNLKAGMVISDYITVAKWTALQDNINGVREHKHKKPYPFSEAIKSHQITAALYNEIIDSINEIGGNLSRTQQGNLITATSMNRLQNGINAL